MSFATFEKSIELLIHCNQRTAFLHNFGEPLLHPDLNGFVAHCTSRSVVASFFTNGTLLTGEVLDGLARAGLRFLCVSQHTRDELDRVRRLLRANRSPIEVRDTFTPVRGRLHSWAGQTRSNSSPASSNPDDGPCLFQREDAAVVLWDGRVNVCCIDAEGAGVQGTVDDYLGDPASYRFRPIALCAGCGLMRGDEDLS
jgi:hypothetical protein